MIRNQSQALNWPPVNEDAAAKVQISQTSARNPNRRSPFNPRKFQNPSTGVAYASGFANPTESRRFFHRKKKFRFGNNRFAPFAPHNTTSYIIRAKRSGGIASLVSPYTLTPMFSPWREVLVDAVKEEWGLDGYGSMKGLIRLRPAGREEESWWSGGDGAVEMEQRLDLDLSRFEMIIPVTGDETGSSLENRVDDQDAHLVRLEEENLTVKKRLFSMENALEDFRRRIHCLERYNYGGFACENGSGNDGCGGCRGEISAEETVGN